MLKKFQPLNLLGYWICILTCGILFSLSPFAPANPSAPPLRCGTAVIDITPDQPVQLAGYAARKGLSQGVHDPLSARVLVFESEGKRLILVSTDLLGFYNGTAESYRRSLLTEFKLQPGELFLSAIHTHSAPRLTLDKNKGHQNNFAYTQRLLDKLTTVIRRAIENLQPVSFGVGRGHSPVGANRRERITGRSGGTRDSMIKLGRNPNGVTDKEVLVMKIAAADGAPLAALFDYATHATSLGGKNYLVGGDVLGLAEQFVEKILGPQTIAPAFAGASGDIDPWFRVLPTFNQEPGWIPEPVLLATLLGEEVIHVYRRIKTSPAHAEIRTAFLAMPLPKKNRPESSSSPNTDNTVPLNITAAHIGPLAFIGLGAEVCTEIGLAIKAASPCEHTFIITHCNGAAGYLPPAHYYQEGGYEVNSSRYAPQAADRVVQQCLKMLNPDPPKNP